MARAKRSGGEASGAAGDAAVPEAGLREGAPFEAALEALEGVVATLESGDLPLEQALLAFENGVKWSRQCAEKLDAAERRIEILLAERGGARAVPFEEASASSDSEGFEDGPEQ